MSRVLAVFLLIFCLNLSVKSQEKSILSTIATNGWANNSVNTVVFRKNSLTTFKNNQYAAYYDLDQFVVLAKRKLNSQTWEIAKTQYKGDATDAHKSISIMIDGAGYLHLAWGQHNNNLNYARSVKPESLVFGNKETMLGLKENKVSYPEFYKLANGNLLFFYRDGGSGNGNLMINRYDVQTKTWKRLQDNLIDGEGKRNVYLQTAIDAKGTIHLSWVWRESPDVASNHDLCYAKSTDGGLTWQNSDGVKYQLPINAANAEYALKIPQNSELINQTSMFADENGNPFIATYWRNQGESILQYHIVYKTGKNWAVNTLAFRKTAFSLSGGGTKKIPISRPQLISWSSKNTISCALVFRDIERGNKVSIAISQDITKEDWVCNDLTSFSVGEWEPTFDTELWIAKKRLDLFVQKVEQVDGEGKANATPTKVQVLTWKR
ncbi:neuraminidase [Pedobacter sp. LMG 31464]|uniref:Neuraminidase n=1 Tax=Pedobacter planticolens TaxID=2679964 RepID=A0A923DXH2_9SPHI|nr:BNR repeat-containing protein [Pedobacter planticolens]MBB2144895.1 neuraminidase [Pedobacter planticolens]